MNERYDLRCGNSREVLKALPDNSVDSCICDPPYALDSIVKRYGSPDAKPTKPGETGVYARGARGFMGQVWDTGDTAFDPEFWAEVWRVLKPGGYLVAFSGTRTYHHLAMAIDMAGFMIEDQFAWMYGSGFPKSHKVAVYIERTLAHMVVEEDQQVWRYNNDNDMMRFEPPFRHPMANAWWGWGTALKPAWEPVCVAQKPLIGTLAENLLAWGVGAMNIDACRIGADGGTKRSHQAAYAKTEDGKEDRSQNWARTGHSVVDLGMGRWPANVIHDGSDGVLMAFPQSDGMKGSVGPHQTGHLTVNAYNPFKGQRVQRDPRGDTGSAARFFYGSKATRRDRNEGCEGPEAKPLNWSSGEKSPGTFQAEGTDRTSPNHHPTVKPTDVMAYLVRLFTPPGGLVLDPFMGSGSTGKAAMLEGMRFFGVDLSDEYVEIARRRVAHAALRAEVAPPNLDLFGA